MKALLLALILFTGARTIAQALDIVTPARTFRDATVMRVEAEGVRISHSEGAEVIDFDDLPAEIQQQYGWTPEKSAARKAERAAKAAEKKRIEDEKRWIEEEPKREAAEAAAKERALKEKAEAEAAARRKVEDAAAQKEMVAAAARARAEIDRERGKAVPMKNGIPVAEMLPAAPDKSESPPSNDIPPPGSVAAALAEKPSPWNRTLLITCGIAIVLVVVVFCLPSNRDKIRVVTPAHEDEP